DKALKRAIRTAVEEKSRYVAERIAITESARAWYQGFLKDTMDDPDVVAYRWVESTWHPTEDICDEYAKVDAYGLGTGIFPKDKVPVLPVHPNCMCRLRPVMTGSDLLQTEHAEDRGNKGGTDYLKKASAETRKKILGVKGAESFEMGKVEDWRTIARGYDEAYMTGRIVEGINTLEDKMRYNLIPPSDEFIAKLAEGQNKPYTLGVEKDGEKRFYSDDGKPIWSANNGGIGHPELILLEKEQEILIRYGKIKGWYVSPLGTTLEERAMPNSTDLAQYHEYEVVHDIDSVEKSTIAPWFGKRGLGIQYRLPCSVETLLQTGKIKEVKT
uniref:TNT domain-containing protein n=1 Tax=uncultured Allisonella sp. TaxID=339338 RepID=UPI0028051CE5